MASILIGHIISSAFCLVSSILIAYQVIRHPNKLRLSILGYSIVTLPASVITTLTVKGLIPNRVNSLVYLVSTLLMATTHCFMMLDVGYRLRPNGAKIWKHPLVIIGITFLGITNILLLIEVCILAINKSGTEEFPFKVCFIAGVCCCIVGDSAIFTFTFQPLIYLRKKRVSEGQTKTTALGIWFFLIQNAWYIGYGALYVWFFIMNSWSHFSTLLAIDYVMRFIENLLYTWPPPERVINYLCKKLPGSSRRSTSFQKSFGMSSERYNMQKDIEYQKEENDKELDNLDTQNRTSSITYGSKVTILTKGC